MQTETVTEINAANVYEFPKDAVVNQTTWPSVWFSKTKVNFQKEKENHQQDVSLKFALANFLNEIDEVNFTDFENP